MSTASTDTSTKADRHIKPPEHAVKTSTNETAKQHQQQQPSVIATEVLCPSGTASVDAPLDGDDMKTDAIAAQITVQISNQSHVFSSVDLKCLQYFEAKLSQRWKENESESKSDACTGADKKISLCEANENIGFSVDELIALLSIHKSKQIPRDFAVRNFESLLRCDDFFAANLIDENTVIQGFKHHTPMLNFEQRQALMTHYNSLQNDAYTLKIKNKLVSGLQKYHSTLSKSASDVILKHYNPRGLQFIKYDAETTTNIFCRQFVVDVGTQYPSSLFLHDHCRGETPKLIDDILSDARVEQGSVAHERASRDMVLKCVVSACQMMKSNCAPTTQSARSSRMYGRMRPRAQYVQPGIKFSDMSMCIDIQSVISKFIVNLDLFVGVNDNVKVKNSIYSLLLQSSVYSVTKYSKTQPTKQQRQQIMDTWNQWVAVDTDISKRNNLKQFLTALYEHKKWFGTTELNQLVANLIKKVAAQRWQPVYETRSIWFPDLYASQAKWIVSQFMEQLPTEQKVEFGLCIVKLIVANENASKISKEYFDLVKSIFGLDWQMLAVQG